MILSNMTDLDEEDSLTVLNTQLNKSMVLMDTTTESEMQQPKNNKTIRINTKIQPPNPSKSSSTFRKSILKKPGKANGAETEQNTENSQDVLNNSDHNKLPTNTATLRPRTLHDLVQEEDLVIEPMHSTFTLDDISDSEDIWIMDIPRTIDPRELKNQTLVLGDKSKFKVREERYCTVNNNVKLSTTCVFSTSKVKSRFKTVNIKPAGAITVRRKLSGVPKIKPMQIENCSVPFPKNLKARHPLFGANFEGKVKKDAVK